jgi:hypothetical protein
MTDKAAFIEELSRKAKRLSADYPEFDVFELSKRKLVACLDALTSFSFAGQNYEVTGRLSKELATQRNENAFWGLSRRRRSAR